MTTDILKHIFTEQRDAFLKKETGVARTALTVVKEKINLPHLVVITGMRRCGKSTLLRQIASLIYEDRGFYYLNFEDERLIHFKASEFNQLYETQVILFGKHKVFFIDEIQNVSGFESFVRRFSDNGFKFIITGSNANLLSFELGSKHTGRHVDIKLSSFSFEEYLRLKGLQLKKNDIYRTEVLADVKKHFSTYLVNGGIPEFLIYDDVEILTRIYNDILIKDIAVRHKVDNIVLLRELYIYLISNVGRRYSYNSLMKIVPLGSVNTIKKYIGYLSETFFVNELQKFDFSLKKQMSNEKKLYISDNGFLHALTMVFSHDKGWYLENLVFNVLSDQYDVFYYSDKVETDFIISKHKKLIQAIQVCYELNKQNEKREIDGVIRSMKNLKIQSGLILTVDQEDIIVVQGFHIEVKPVWKWILMR